MDGAAVGQGGKPLMERRGARNEYTVGSCRYRDVSGTPGFGAATAFDAEGYADDNDVHRGAAILSHDSMLQISGPNSL